MDGRETAMPPALQSLIDHAALRDVAMRYARAIDRRDRALLLSCYHPDAIDHHGTMFRGDPAAYADWQPEIMAQFEVTAHYIMNCHYRVAGAGAEGELYFIAYHRTAGPDARDVMVGGRYLDRYERRDGEWRIVHRRIAWDFARGATCTKADAAFLAGLGEPGRGTGDPSVAALPLLGA